MKWLILIDKYLPEVVGGNVIYVKRFVEKLIERGEDVTLLTTTGLKNTPAYEEINHLKIHRIYNNDGKVGPLRFKSREIFTQKVEELIKKENFDIVNTHTACLLTLNFLKNVKKDYNFKLLSTYHAIHSYEILFNLKKYLSIKTFNLKEICLFLPKILSMYTYEYYTAKYTDKIIVMSEYVKNTIRNFLGNKYLNKVSVTGIGVTEPEFKQISKEEAREKLHLNRDKTIFITVRRLAPRMGLFNLIKAFYLSNNENSELYIIGKGEFYKKLNIYIKKLKIENKIKLTGYVDDETLNKYYCAADCFILPTEELEGFGIVTIEALNYNLPVIGTPKGATPEILSKFKNNLLTDSHSPKDIAKKIKNYLANKDFYDRIDYKEKINKEYNWNTIIDKIMRD